MEAFKLRVDKLNGLIEVQLQANGAKGARVMLDPSFLRGSLSVLKEYVAGVPGDPDDQSQKDEIANTSEDIYFANIVHTSHVGVMSETIFGVFSLHDFVDASRAAQEKSLDSREVVSVDNLVAISAPGPQKKLILELLGVLLG